MATTFFYYLNTALMTINWKSYFTWFFLIIAFVSPLANMYHLMFFAVLVDMITGIWAAVKRKDLITSAKMKMTIYKMFIYMITLTLVYAFEKVVFAGMAVPVSNLWLGIIVLNEIKSVTENSDVILGTNVFTGAYRSIKKIFIKNKLDNDANSKEE